jgi:hypothetical protein
MKKKFLIPNTRGLPKITHSEEKNTQERKKEKIINDQVDPIH